MVFTSTVMLWLMTKGLVRNRMTHNKLSSKPTGVKSIVQLKLKEEVMFECLMLGNMLEMSVTGN